MVSGGLESGLGVGLGEELDKDSIVLLVVSREPLSLSIVGLGNQLAKLLTAPFDSVDLLANETKGSKTVSRALLIGDPAGSKVSRLGIRGSRGSLLSVFTRLLDEVDALLVDQLEKLDLSLLQLHGSLITLLDNLVQLLGVAWEPNVLDRVVEEGTNAGLIEVLLGNGCEEDGSGRDALSILRGEEESLADIDVKDTLAKNGVNDKAVNDPSDKAVGIEAVPLS